MPNPGRSDAIACPGEMPPEMKMDQYIDYPKQFDKSFTEPIKSIADIIDWKLEETNTLEDFFR
jgi:hypothetical protein